MDQTSMTRLSHHVELEGAFNFRDLGGYSTLDGRSVKRGMLYRSDNLSQLSDTDLIVLKKLEIKTVIDLRTPKEAQVRGRFPVDRLKVDYLQSSLIDISADHSLARGEQANEYIFSRYTQILTEGSPGIKGVFDRLSSPAALPAVFHCAIGKDRTGLIAALMLDLLGTQPEAILEDYALTAKSVSAMVSWLEQVAPEIAAQIQALPPAVMSAESSNMARVLDWLDSSYGGARGYLAAIGVAEARIDALRMRLLE